MTIEQHEFEETNQRIDSIDSDMRSLTLQVGQLDTNMQNVIKGVTELSDTVKMLNTKISHSTKTDWGLLASWAAVTLTVMAGYSHLNMSPLEDEIGRLRTWKTETIDRIIDLNEKGAVHRERIRSLERSQFEEPKDQ